jgi:predicted ATPase/DNA-binding winged helix-turn-helix (wHTH) protein
MEHCKHYVLKFGDFELEMPHKLLNRDGVRLKLGGRAASLLAVLADANGELVSRDELLSQVWPDQTIDDSAIRVHLSALRKVLGPTNDGNHLIVNEAGRGYRLALTVSRADSFASNPPSTRDHANINLPARIEGIIGRDETIASLSDELIKRRLITIAGPGGIGKTTVSVAVGRVTAQRTGSATFFIDFSPIDNYGRVASTIATTLGVTASTADLIETLIGAFQGKPGVMVFDNCEHVLEEVSRIAESLLFAVPDMMILCTSREPLGAQGEWIHRLAPLKLPPVGAENTPEFIGTFPSVQLFCERAQSVRNDFVLGPENHVAVADICNRLDGIPLAIEFAAARMNALTAVAIAAGLKERFDLLSKGRRTAIPRHKTLRATLDWSYDQLCESARKVLNRLSVFRSSFTVADAQAVASGRDIDDLTVFDELVDLVEKSMLMTQSVGGEMYYRLLETTRQYAMEKLVSSGEADNVRRKHAEHITSHFSDTKEAWEGKTARARIDIRSRYIDDVSAAIDWGLSEDGDISLGQDVLAASSSLWFHMSLPGEFISHTRRFLSEIRYDGACDRSFELLAAYGHALWHKEGPFDEMRDAFEKALLIAQARNDKALVLRAIWGIWAQQILFGAYAQSLVTANEFMAQLLPDDSVANRATGLHMQALSSHFDGDHATALMLLEQVIEADKAPVRIDHANHAQVDGKIAVMSLLMRIKWLTGTPKDALQMATICAADAFDLGHTLSICYGLGVGCIPVAIANKEYDLARQWIKALRARTTAKGLDHWGHFADGYEAALEGRRDIPLNSSTMQREMFMVAQQSVAGENCQPSDIKWISKSFAQLNNF